MQKKEDRAAKRQEVAGWNRVVATVLVATRRELDMTQLQVAAEVGLTRDELANIERGRRKVSPGEFILFAKAFRMQADALMRRCMRWQLP